MHHLEDGMGCSLFSDKQYLAEYRHTIYQQERFIMFLKTLLSIDVGLLHLRWPAAKAYQATITAS